MRKTKQALLILLLVMIVQQVCAASQNELDQFEFENDGNSEAWSTGNALRSVIGGTLSGTATSNDPQLFRSGFLFAGSSSDGVMIRYRGSANGNLALFWGRKGSENYSGSRSVQVNYNGDGDWQTLYFDTTAHAEWSGKTITRLRVDPAGTTGDSFEIDWIRVNMVSWDSDSDGWRDIDEGTVDSDGDGLPDWKDPDSDNDNHTDAWTKAVNNAPGSVHFNFDSDTQGWAGLGGLTLNEIVNGELTASIEGATMAQLTRGRLHLWAGLIQGVHMRIRVPTAGNVTLFWSHDIDQTFNNTRKITVPVDYAGGEYQTVRFDMRSAPEWYGNLITELRFTMDFPASTVVTIDWIRTSDGDYDRDRISDHDEGDDDLDGDGWKNFEDPDSDGDGVSDAAEVGQGWNPYDPIEKTLDSDSDGASDALESAAGTSPFDTTDNLTPSIVIENTQINLSFPGRLGRRYRLQSKETLSIPWTNHAWSSEALKASDIQWNIEQTADTEFYQIEIESPLQDPEVEAAVVEVASDQFPALDNGTLRLEAPVNQGSSFNYLAPYNGSILGGNLINWHDKGRLIQQSYYAGTRLNRTDVGQSSRWSPWPWNPIQGGDASLKVAPVLETTVCDFGTGFFTRTIPLLWDMLTGEEGKCYMDQWNEFEPGMDHVIRVTCRLTVFRDADDLWGDAVLRAQELPAVYLIRNLSKAVAYFGENPWTGDDPESFDYSTPKGSFPWARVLPTENWVALVHPNTNTGVGLYSPISNINWHVGSYGGSSGGPTSAATMHMAPLRSMRLDRDSIMVYRYWIIHGDLDTIRNTVYQLHTKYPGG